MRAIVLKWPSMRSVSRLAIVAAMTSPSLLFLDSITKLTPGAKGAVVVAGSHGGVYCGYLAARGALRGVILNDAGLGLDEAGVSGLAYLEKLGIPAASVGHDTARIGDGQDMMRRGRI